MGYFQRKTQLLTEKEGVGEKPYDIIFFVIPVFYRKFLRSFSAYFVAFLCEKYSHCQKLCNTFGSRIDVQVCLSMMMSFGHDCMCLSQFWFCEFLLFPSENKSDKMEICEIPKPTKVISRKIWFSEDLLDFHTVEFLSIIFFLDQ